MDSKIFALLFLLVFSISPLAFSAESGTSSQTEQEKLTALRESISKSAGFIRQVNSDPGMTQKEKDVAIKSFLKKQNEETSRKAAPENGQ